MYCMSRSCEHRVITKESNVWNANLILLFKLPLYSIEYFSDIAEILIIVYYNYRPVFFQSFETCTAHPILKLTRFTLLDCTVNWLNRFYSKMNSKYNITLFFFDNN